MLMATINLSFFHSQVFITKFKLLQSIGDFARACSLLLEFIECSALSKSNEVSLAALKSFQEILYNKPINSMKSNGEDEDLWNVRKLCEFMNICLTIVFILGRLESMAERRRRKHKDFIQ
jgi:hypothetical protein